jgi:hypothetical protein
LINLGGYGGYGGGYGGYGMGGYGGGYGMGGYGGYGGGYGGYGMGYGGVSVWLRPMYSVVDSVCFSTLLTMLSALYLSVRKRRCKFTSITFVVAYSLFLLL